MKPALSLTLTLALGIVGRAVMAAPAPTIGAKPIAIRPGADNTDIVVVPAPEDSRTADLKALEQQQTLMRYRQWSRASAGFWVSTQNAGVLKSHIHTTSDTTLFGHTSEFGYGIGGLLDLPYPGGSGKENLRLRLGILRMAISPDNTVAQNNPTLNVEDSETLVNLTGIYRVATDLDLGYGILWYGAGLSLSHVYSTGFQGTSGSTSTQLLGSNGLNFLAAAGIDHPFSETALGGVELDWIPMSGFTLSFNYKTSL